MRRRQERQSAGTMHVRLSWVVFSARGLEHCALSGQADQSSIDRCANGTRRATQVVFSSHVVNDLRTTAPQCCTRWTPVSARRSLGDGLRYRANRRSNSHTSPGDHFHPCANSYALACPCDRAHANPNARAYACADGSRRAVRDLVVHRRCPCSRRHPRVRPGRMASLDR